MVGPMTIASIDLKIVGLGELQTKMTSVCQNTFVIKECSLNLYFLCSLNLFVPIFYIQHDVQPDIIIVLYIYDFYIQKPQFPSNMIE